MIRRFVVMVLFLLRICGIHPQGSKSSEQAEGTASLELHHSLEERARQVASTFFERTRRRL